MPKKTPSLADSHLGMESMHAVLGTEPANFRGLGPQATTEEITVICQPCRERDHGRCEDATKDEARYSSCHCQHRGVKPEPATGPAGE